MTESSDATYQIDRASSPAQFEQNKPQNLDVTSATIEKSKLKNGQPYLGIYMLTTSCF